MEPVEELRYLILGAQREGARALAELLRPAGLTAAQAEVLAVLREAGKPLTVREIGERLVCEGGRPRRRGRRPEPPRRLGGRRRPARARRAPRRPPRGRALAHREGPGGVRPGPGRRGRASRLARLGPRRPRGRGGEQGAPQARRRAPRRRGDRAPARVAPAPAIVRPVPAPRACRPARARSEPPPPRGRGAARS